MKKYLKYKKGHIDQNLVEEAKKFKGEYLNVFIKFDPVLLNRAINNVRKNVSDGHLIEKGTYAIHKGGLLMTNLTERKFWRILDHLGDAITSMGTYQKIVDKYDNFDYDILECHYEVSLFFNKENKENLFLIYR